MNRSVSSTAGRSIAEEYRARRADWLANGGQATRRRARIAAAIVFGLELAGLVTLEMTAGVHPWLLWSLVVMAAGVAIAIAEVFGAAPTDIADLDTQARAEQSVARSAEVLQRSGYTLLPDRSLPDLQGHLSLLAIGPSGVFAVTAVPAWTGFRTIYTTVMAGRVPLNAVADTAVRTAQLVAEALAGVLSEWAEIVVQPLVVVATNKPLPLGLEAVLSTPVVDHKRLPGWLRYAYPRTLTDLHVAALVAAADTVLPPARALTDTAGWFTSHDTDRGTDLDQRR